MQERDTGLDVVSRAVAVQAATLESLRAEQARLADEVRRSGRNCTALHKVGRDPQRTRNPHRGSLPAGMPTMATPEPPSSGRRVGGGVVVDVRALQAHEHASRGIGRYSIELIRAIEQIDPTMVRAFVADPAFPLHERLRDLLDTGKVIRADHPSLADDPPRVLHVTSPFVEGHGPVRILPTWAASTDTRVVSTVYDLIPARFPEVYLTDPTVAAEYHARLQFLRSCDRLLTIWTRPAQIWSRCWASPRNGS